MQDRESINYDNEREFLGVWIPRNLWVSDLPLQEKCLLVEIESLSKGPRGCFKSNKALGRHMMLSQSRISSIIASLASKGIVTINQVRDGKQCIERQIFMNCRLVDIATKAPYVAKGGISDSKGGISDSVRPPFENSEESNTLSNTNENKTLRPSDDKSPDEHSGGNLDCPHMEILDIWKEVMPEKPSPNPSMWANTQRARDLAARWKEGFSIKRVGGQQHGKFLYTNREEGIEWWRRFFMVCRRSDFLMGKGRPSETTGKAFDPDIAWFVRRNNFVKILERKYHPDHQEQPERPVFKNGIGQ